MHCHRAGICCSHIRNPSPESLLRLAMCTKKAKRSSAFNGLQALADVHRSRDSAAVHPMTYAVFAKNVMVNAAEAKRLASVAETLASDVGPLEKVAHIAEAEPRVLPAYKLLHAMSSVSGHKSSGDGQATIVATMKALKLMKHTYKQHALLIEAIGLQVLRGSVSGVAAQRFMAARLAATFAAMMMALYNRMRKAPASDSTNSGDEPDSPSDAVASSDGENSSDCDAIEHINGGFEEEKGTEGMGGEPGRADIVWNPFRSPLAPPGGARAGNATEAEVSLPPDAPVDVEPDTFLQLITTNLRECTTLLSRVHSELCVSTIAESTLKVDRVGPAELISSVLNLRRIAPKWRTAFFAAVNYVGATPTVSEAVNEELVSLVYVGINAIRHMQGVTTRLAKIMHESEAQSFLADSATPIRQFLAQLVSNGVPKCMGPRLKAVFKELRLHKAAGATELAPHFEMPKPESPDDTKGNDDSGGAFRHVQRQLRLKKRNKFHKRVREENVDSIFNINGASQTQKELTPDEPKQRDFPQIPSSGSGETWHVGPVGDNSGRARTGTQVKSKLKTQLDRDRLYKDFAAAAMRKQTPGRAQSRPPATDAQRRAAFEAAAGSGDFSVADPSLWDDDAGDTIDVQAKVGDAGVVALCVFTCAIAVSHL